MNPANQKSLLSPTGRKLVVLFPILLLLLGWLFSTPPGLLGKADAVGYAVCHRIDARSFHLGDRQVPLCARCSGMYLGAMLGLIFQGFISPGKAGLPPRRLWLPLIILVGAFGIDGANSYLHFFPGAPGLYEPQNWSRLLTGTGMGLVMSAGLYPAFNQTIWKNLDMRPALPGLRAFGGLIILALLLNAIVLLENPLILYPLALISAGGVLLLLSMVYALAWVMIFKKDNQYERLSQAAIPLIAGFGVGLLQIVIINIARFWLTGTWDGFTFG